VTGTAASQRKDVLTSLDKITTVLLGPSIDRMDQKKEKEKKNICVLSSWQHLMPLLLPGCVK